MTDPAGPDGYVLVFAEDFTGGVLKCRPYQGSLSSAGLMSSSNVTPLPSSRRFRGSPVTPYPDASGQPYRQPIRTKGRDAIVGNAAQDIAQRSDGRPTV